MNDEKKTRLAEFAAAAVRATFLASRTLAARIPGWQACGYYVGLLFMWLPNADMAVQRVAQRVQSGGHDIPEATIRRRYR